MTTRRDLIAAAALLAPQSATKTLLKPAVLKPGDTVGLITPSTYVSDPDRIATAVRTIEYFGLKMKMGRNVRKQTGYVGDTIAQRVSDLHDMFRDPEVKAVFTIRGGYGSGQLLDDIDYDLIRRNPKIFVGYSDITALHLAIGKRTGLVTFHGPVVLSGFSAYTQEWFRKAMFSPQPLGAVTNPPESNLLRPAHPLRTVRPGKGR